MMELFITSIVRLIMRNSGGLRLLPVNRWDVLPSRFPKTETKNRRILTELNEDWKTWLIDHSQPVNTNSLQRDNAINCQLPLTTGMITIGYRQLTHGNLNGTSMYVKDFTLDNLAISETLFSSFRRERTYATIQLNGQDFGRHPVGRTTLTLDDRWIEQR